MSVESVTQAVSNLALAFGDDDADPGAMVSDCHSLLPHFPTIFFFLNISRKFPYCYFLT